ncbi:MAG: hypothetical protein JW809_08925 [Pirellulales bacterium]|nr:hypothetical protein [Pirellulales bacterium]
MRPQPPESLVRLLAELGLARADQLAALAGPARRLARGVPLFASVWVDVAARAGILSPFQAAEINAGRGEGLRAGPWALWRPLAGLGYAGCYEARRIRSGVRGRLARIDPAGSLPRSIEADMERLAQRADALDGPAVPPVIEVGFDRGQPWAACRWIDGWTAHEWMIHHGRLPGGLALEIAREMIAGLAALERAGACHGDIRAATVLLTANRPGRGCVAMPYPGLRGLARPAEGFAHADLPPEALDGLAPERIGRGEPPSIRSDLFACGYLWWHLLAGRAPALGGDGLAKLRAIVSREIPDVRRVAPDVPEPLARAIAACTAVDPSRRPSRPDEVAVMLGASDPASGRRAAGALARGIPRRTAWNRPLAMAWLIRPAAVAVAAALVVAAAATAIAWSLGRGGLPEVAEPQSVGVVEKPTPAIVEKPAGQGNAKPPEPNRTLPPSLTPSESGELVLPAGWAQGFDPASLRAGQRVRGAGPEATVLRVGPAGLAIAVPGVQFEGIEFVWDHPANESGDQQLGIVRLDAAEATFRRCTFRAASGQVAAILWTYPAQRDAARHDLPSGRVVLEDCILASEGATVECHAAGTLVLEFRNALKLGAGPLVRLDHAPRADEPTVIRLARTTLRESGPLLECRGLNGGPVGAIAVETRDCVLATRESSPLVLLAGGAGPEAFLDKLRWTGAGSLVEPKAAIARWQSDDGEAAPIDDGSISIDGVVRGRVTFAGSADLHPANSEATLWQAPLRSTAPPGIDPTRLPKPAT